MQSLIKIFKTGLLFCFVFFNNLQSFSQYSLKQSNWQQQCDYDIQVYLDDQARILHGKIKITYTNHSPQTLNEIYMHVWPNAYKNNETPFAIQQVENGKLDFYYSPDSVRGSIDSFAYTVNGQACSFSTFQSEDIQLLKLNQPLTPGSSCVIETPFRVFIPKVFSRLGWGVDNKKNYNFNMTQWYPKPAVYDINGWNAMPYLDQGEFYSEFGNFQVSITTNKYFEVAATGNLISQKEHSDQTKTVIYKQNNVHDFAWFANKYFKYDTMNVTLESGRNVKCQLYYTGPLGSGKRQSSKDVLENMKQTVLFLSKHVGEYPYDVVSVVQGPLIAGGGMEYPTITVMPSLDDRTVEHEIGHNWFYGILGSQERDHPWMDEGINSFYEDWYFKRNNPNKPEGTFFKAVDIGSAFSGHYLLYQLQQILALDQAIEEHAHHFTETNYGAIVYGKTALVFQYLHHYLGTETMDACMNEYYNLWKFKHPLPSDIQEVFERVSGKNLGWLFDALINTTNTVDYALKKAKVNNGKLEITIKNTSKINSPVFVDVKLKNNKGSQKYIFDGFKGKKKFTIDIQDWEWVMLDSSRWMMENNRRNNMIVNRLLFKKMEPLKIHMIAFGKSMNRILYINPMMAWNKYDGFMLGTMISNDLLPAHTFQYTLVPFYGFKSKQLVGMADLTWFIKRPVSNVRLFELGANIRRFNTATFLTALKFDSSTSYIRSEAFLHLHFLNKNPRSNRNNVLSFRYILITESGWVKQTKKGFSNTQSFPVIEFQSKDKKVLHPVSFGLKYMLGNGFDREELVIKGHINYTEKKKLIYRVFGGMINQNASTIDGRYYLRPTSNQNLYDFTYDQLAFSRGSLFGFWGNHLQERDGNVHIGLPVTGNQIKRLLSINLESSLPLVSEKLPIKLFFDFAAFNNQINTTSIYTGGFSVELIGRSVLVYIPIFSSKQIQDIYELNYSGSNRVEMLFRKITFMIDLEKINLMNRKKLSISNLM